MTTNSVSSGSVSTSSIDVASIVSQLMTVANQPLVRLQTKVKNDQAVISDLGTLTSRLSGMQKALNNLEDPITYLNSSASSSSSSNVDASVSAGAMKGTYNIGVIQTAAAASNVVNFGSLADSTSATLNLTAPFQLTIGGTTYSSNQAYGTNGSVPALSSTPTLSQLSGWIQSLNFSLDLNVSSSIVQTTTGNYSMVVSGTRTGAVNNVTVANTGSASYSLSSSQAARDAVINVNGVTVQRSSNSISDIYNNNPITFKLGTPVVSNAYNLEFNALSAGQSVTMNGLTYTAGLNGASANDVASALSNLSSGVQGVDLTDPTGSGGTYSGILTSPTSAAVNSILSLPSTSAPTISASDPGTLPKVNVAGTPQTSATITISQGVDNSAAAIQGFVSAYNDMISQYKSMVSNTNQSSTAVNGTFANDPIMLSFVENIKRKLSSGLIAGNGNTISLSNLGMDFQNDGTLKFNATKLSNFKDPHYSNVMEALGSGIHLGGVLDQSGSYISRSSLVDDLTNLLSPNGTLAVSIKMQNTDISNIQSKQQALSNQLSVLQASYTRQYSNLNALLFTLSQTSSQLTSSLTAVTNINSGK